MTRKRVGPMLGEARPGAQIMNIPATAATTGQKARFRITGASETIKLSGQVTTGQGGGHLKVRRDAEKLQDALGVTIVEGSLNVILKHPVMLTNDTALRIDADRGWPRLLWPGRVNETDVWLTRWHKPLHAVGLLSAVHLRKHFNLSDGDEIQIEVRKRDVGRIANVGRLTWTLFWAGRRHWFNGRRGYCKRAERWCKPYGATQLPTEKDCHDLSLALTKALIKKIPRARSL